MASIPAGEQLANLQRDLHDRYTVEAKIGTGGMADVYRAIDLKHGRPVAVKVLRGELGDAMGVDRFGREIEIAARLQHPNILPVYDSGEVAGTVFYTMPFVVDGSLRTRLDASDPLTLPEIFDIVREVADALAFAHRCNIVHRDVKPENILFLAGHAVVADFGIARAIEAATEERLTLAGFGVGTPEYVSPEQAFGETNIDGRSDVYSLACVTYEMLTGVPPHTGKSAAAVLHHKTTPAMPSLAAVRPQYVLVWDSTDAMQCWSERWRWSLPIDFRRQLRSQVHCARQPPGRKSLSQRRARMRVRRSPCFRSRMLAAAAMMNA